MIEFHDNKTEPNNVNSGTADLCTFDWGRVVRYCVFGDPRTSRVVANMYEMVLTLNREHPHIQFAIVGEATFMSYPVSGEALRAENVDMARRVERDAVIDFVRAHGHTLEVFETRMTANTRRHLGLQGEVPLRGKEKDEADDKTIIHIARTKPLRRALKSTEYNADLRAKREKAQNFLNALRFSGRKKEFVEFVVEAAALPAVKVKERGPLVKRTKPGKELLSAEEAIAWDDGYGKYHVVSMAAVVVCATFADSQREFDSLLGFSENATGSLMRSDIMHHRWAVLKERGEISKRNYQRSLRFMYRDLRDADIRAICDRFTSERIQ